MRYTMVYHMKREMQTVSTKITPTDFAVIQTEIRRGRSINTSDFVRQAIREKIAKLESS